ncbi:MAG: D-alanyl-D-alanine carboxypeptidase [Acidobacteria bacterium]|nr:D-alanyl-D-alanine carboxypeptidase [Candidatus Sulfomarinibacter kjeldsenii]
MKTDARAVGAGFTPDRGATNISRTIRCAIAVVFVVAAIGADAADRDQLLFHAETLKGRELQSQNADTPFNPASLVKVGTSLWAIESLGAEHRYRTVFGVDGEWDKQTGRLVGSLVVQGWGDPDMQPENVFLVARQLNKLRLFRVEGWLRIDGDFWISRRGPPGRRCVRGAGGTQMILHGLRSSARCGRAPRPTGPQSSSTARTRCRSYCGVSTSTPTTTSFVWQKASEAPRASRPFSNRGSGWSQKRWSWKRPRVRIGTGSPPPRTASSPGLRDRRWLAAWSLRPGR